ncbi:MAG: radical SAM protein [Thermodesulfobacteriota bacterium]
MIRNLRLATHVLRNWASYILGAPDPVPIGYVILGVTYACNGRCLMCDLHYFYRDHPARKGAELETDTLLRRLWESRIIRNVRHLDITGGEPFLRKDLSDLVIGLFRMPRLELVSVNTNGMDTPRVVSHVKEILGNLAPEQGFSMSLSVDGVGDLHDRIRGVDGAFTRLTDTIHLLRGLRVQYPNFSLRSNTVIQPENVHALDQIGHFCKVQGLQASFSLFQNPYYTRRRTEASPRVPFAPDEIEKIKSIGPKSKGMNYYLDHGFKRPLHCFAGYAALFIDPFGAVYPCNYLTGNEGYRMGSIQESSLDSIWTSALSSRVRGRVKACPETRCWNGCEVDQTLIQHEPLDRLVRASTFGLLGYYRLRGLKGFQ